MPSPELRTPLPAEAVEAWANACAQPLPAAEWVPVEEALGSTTTAPVRALRSSPGFAASAMDGIAVVAAALGAASRRAPVRLAPGEFEVVDTGDPLPPGRDTIIPHERIELARGTAVVTAAPERGRNVRGVGEDVAAGELLFVPGHRLDATDIALAAAAGHRELAVSPPATVAVLPTGDELRPAGAELAPGQLADTNSIMLSGQARAAGYRAVRWPILPDDPQRLEAAVREAVTSCDVVLVLAGTSAGRHDHAPDVLRACGRIIASGVAVRPGHPAVLAVVDGKPVMGCPGYPVSAAVAFDQLVLPLLGRLRGALPEAKPGVTARLAVAIASRGGVQEHLRVALGSVDGRLVAVPLRRGASVLSALSRADGLITVPPDREGLGRGARVTVSGLGGDVPGSSDLLVAGSPDRALELVVLACAARGLRVAHCEMALSDAFALLASGGCHAAWLDGPVPADAGDLVRLGVAEREIGIAVGPGNPLGIHSIADLREEGTRAVSGPAAWDELPEQVERMRSDDAALAAVAGGYADCAVVAVPAARAAGLETYAARRTSTAVALRRGSARSDAGLAALVEALADPSLATALRAEGYEPVADTRSAA